MACLASSPQLFSSYSSSLRDQMRPCSGTPPRPYSSWTIIPLRTPNLFKKLVSQKQLRLQCRLDPPRERLRGRGGADSRRGGRQKVADDENTAKKKFKSSWDAKDSQGNDYLYRLGKEADNLSITVGAKQGVIDDLFIGDFLGKDSDIVFKYRQKVTRQFGHLTGEYYIAPAFMDKVVTHIVKNFLVDEGNLPGVGKVPLILGIWGGKGQGKSFQVELIFRALGLEPVIMSAGELENEWAGQPGRLIRERYRTASQVVKVQGKLSALVINDLDAGVGHFANTQMTVNNQMISGTLMNLADNPNTVSVGQSWRDDDVVRRIPIIITGNDLSTLYAPLVRDGRMDKFYWQPTREDRINIVYMMYKKDGLTMEDITTVVDTFPGQSLDFFGAMRAKTYDDQVREWIKSIGGETKMKDQFLKREKPTPVLAAQQQSIETLLAAGRALEDEQTRVMETKLSEEYMKHQTGDGGMVSVSVY